MKRPLVTFEQADSGRPAAVAARHIEAVYAIERDIGDPVCGCGHAKSRHETWTLRGMTGPSFADESATRCQDDCNCDAFSSSELTQARTVIKMVTGNRYEVLDSVAVVLGRIEAVNERD